VYRQHSRFFRGGLPLLPFGPGIVIIVGIATAVAVGQLGIRELGRTSDNASALRAEVLAASIAARLRSAPVEERTEIVGRAARRSASEILLVDQSGSILVDESFRTPPREEIARLVAAGSGESSSALGRVRFAARALHPPLANLAVLTFVAAPSPPPGSFALGRAVAALTVLLLGVAATVAWTFTRAARDDVDYVRRRILEIARSDADPAGQPIPIRSLDQVGVLTAAFNLLVSRFAAAERTYRADLRQAAEIDRERSAFLAGLSHELRTPLNAILGFAHVLESEVDGPLTADAQESLAMIRKSGEHLRTLIDDILDLSALETGSLELSRGPVDVRKLAEEILREASATALSKPLRLQVTGESGLFAFADTRRVRQILTNLISNAVKFTSAGAVTVDISRRGRAVSIAVRDTGPGIPPEESAAIFEEYRQSGDLRSRRAGTGLGLAIARRLVLMHQGTIDVASQVGRGSTFTVTLPLADASRRSSLVNGVREGVSAPPPPVSQPGGGSRPASNPPGSITKPPTSSQPGGGSRSASNPPGSALRAGSADNPAAALDFGPTSGAPTSSDRRRAR
jgi:signal transduction histidine kinase